MTNELGTMSGIEPWLQNLFILCMLDFQFFPGTQRRAMADAEDSKIQNERDEVWREKGAMERRRVFNPLTSVFKQLAHLAQLVKAWTVHRCSQRSSVRISPGPVLSFFFPNLHIFNYFLFSFDLIFSCYFNSFHIFISALKNHQNNFFLLHYFHKMFI